MRSRANDARIELAYVLGSDANAEAREDAEELLVSATEMIGEHETVDHQLLGGKDVAETIVERSGDHDLTIVGATREGVLQQFVFGAIPEAVARRAESTVIMAKRKLPLTSRLSRLVRSNRR